MILKNKLVVIVTLLVNMALLTIEYKILDRRSLIYKELIELPCLIIIIVVISWMTDLFRKYNFNCISVPFRL